MANRAYLIGSNHSEPAGPSDKGINYDPDTEILAGASYLIPVFWLSLFEESHIKEHVVDEFRIPSLVCSASTGRRLLQERRERILETFPSCDSVWQEWAKMVDEAQFQFFKLDATEIWDLSAEGFDSQLQAAIRWLSSGSPEDLADLISLAGMTLITKENPAGRGASCYDPTNKTLTIRMTQNGPADSIGHLMHGYGWVRDVPWKDE